MGRQDARGSEEEKGEEGEVSGGMRGSKLDTSGGGGGGGSDGLKACNHLVTLNYLSPNRLLRLPLGHLW